MSESGVTAVIPIEDEGFVHMKIQNKPEVHGAAAGCVLKMVCREPIPDDLLIGSIEDRIERIFGGNNNRPVG